MYHTVELLQLQYDLLKVYWWNLLYHRVRIIAYSVNFPPFTLSLSLIYSLGCISLFERHSIQINLQCLALGSIPYHQLGVIVISAAFLSVKQIVCHEVSYVYRVCIVAYSVKFFRKRISRFYFTDSVMPVTPDTVQMQNFPWGPRNFAPL